MQLIRNENENKKRPINPSNLLQWPDTIMCLTKDKRLEVSILNQM